MNNTEVLSKEISRKISFFNWGFILIIVLFHSELRYFYPLIEDFTAVSISYFFYISAFFFYRGLSSENNFIRLKKRCFSLLLPYFLWNFIYVLLYLRLYKFTFESLIRGFTVSPFCMPTWYFLTLFIFFLPSPFIKRALEKSHLTIIMLILGVTISYLGYIRFQQELALIPFFGGYLIRMAAYLIPYLLGAIIATRFENGISVKWKDCVIGIFGSCIIIFLLLCNISIEMRWILCFILPLALWEAVPENLFRVVKILNLITEPAFWVNMTHCYFLFVWGAITVNNGHITRKYLAILNIVITLMTSYALYYLLKLVMPKGLKILTGNRIK